MQTWTVRKKIHFGRIAPCLLAIVVDNLGFGLVYPVFASLFTERTPLLGGAGPELRSFFLGLSYLLYPLCMFFGASFLGDLSDMLERKRVVLICMLGITVSFLLMGFGITFTSLFLLLLGRALSGLFAGSQPIVQASIIDQSTPQTKAFNMSLIGLTLSLGLILGPIIGGFFSDPELANVFGYSTPFYISAVIAGICVLWVQFSFEETYKEQTEKHFDLFRPVRIFLEAFLNHKIRFLSLIFLLMQIGFSFFFTLGVVYLRKKYNYSEWEMGAFNGWIGVSFAFGMLFVARKVTKVFHAEWIAAWAMLITAIGQVFFFLPLSPVWVWILAFPVAGADVLAYTTMLTSFSNTANDKSQGWVMGVAVAVMAVAWVISGLGTNLLDIMGANIIIAIGGVCLLLSSGLMFLYSFLHKNEFLS